MPSRPTTATLTATLAWAVLVVVAALAAPPLGGADEPSHVIWAAAAARGDVLPPEVVLTDPASGFTRTDSTVTVPSGYAGLHDLPACHAGRPEVTADCAPPVPSAVGAPTTTGTTAGTYLPAWYAAVGLPTLLPLGPDAALVAMRVVGGLLAAALLGAAVASLRRQRAGPGLTIGALLAVTPVALHLAGTVNPSGLEVAAALVVWVAGVEVLAAGPPPRAALASLGVALVALALARPVGPVWAVGLPVVLVLALGRPGEGSTTRRLRPALAVGAVAVAVGLAWSLTQGTFGAFSGIPRPEATGLTAVAGSLARTPDRAAQLVSVLGWADVQLPRLVVWGWLVAWGGGLAAALVVGARRVAVVAVLVGVGVLLLPVVAEVGSAARIGYAWQGRYSLPLAMGIPVLAGVAVDRRGVRWPQGVWATAAGAWAVVQVVAVGVLLGRYEVGAPAGWGDVLTRGAWEPTVPDGLLLVLAVAGVVGVVAALSPAAGPRPAR